MAVDWQLEVERRGAETRVGILLEDGNEIVVNLNRRTVTYDNAPTVVATVNRTTETNIHPDARQTRF